MIWPRGARAVVADHVVPHTGTDTASRLGTAMLPAQPEVDRAAPHIFGPNGRTPRRPTAIKVGAEHHHVGVAGTQAEFPLSPCPPARWRR